MASGVPRAKSDFESPAPGRRQAETLKKSLHQPGVAEPDFQPRGAGGLGGVERDAQNFRVGGLAVLAAEALEPRLRELPVADAKNRAAIGQRGGLAGLGRRQIIERDGNGVFGPQAKLRVAAVVDEIKPPAKILAEPVEKHPRRLQQRGLAPREPRVDKMRQHRIEPFLFCWAVRPRHENPLAFARSL